MSVAFASPPITDTEQPSPLKRLRAVAARRAASTKEQTNAQARKVDALYSAQNTLYRRSDFQIVSAQAQKRAEDYFTFLVCLLDPSASVSVVKVIARELGTGPAGKGVTQNHAFHDTVSGGNTWGSYIGRGDDGEPQYGVKPGNVTFGLPAPGEVQEEYTLDPRDWSQDRANDFLYNLFLKRGEAGDDKAAFRVEAMCRALLRGYRSKQRFAATVEEFTDSPVPSLSTVVNAGKCMDGEAESLTYMEMLSRWLPEIIPVAESLLTHYDDVCRVEKAVSGANVSMMRGMPKRGEPIETLSPRILRAYSVVPNADALAKAFRKRAVEVRDFLKDRGVYQAQGGVRKEREY